MKTSVLKYLSLFLIVAVALLVLGNYYVAYGPGDIGCKPTEFNPDIYHYSTKAQIVKFLSDNTAAVSLSFLFFGIGLLIIYWGQNPSTLASFCLYLSAVALAFSAGLWIAAIQLLILCENQACECLIPSY